MSGGKRRRLKIETIIRPERLRPTKIHQLTPSATSSCCQISLLVCWCNSTHTLFRPANPCSHVGLSKISKKVKYNHLHASTTWGRHWQLISSKSHMERKSAQLLRLRSVWRTWMFRFLLPHHNIKSALTGDTAPIGWFDRVDNALKTHLDELRITLL